jgi:hypothetical protein
LDDEFARIIVAHANHEASRGANNPVDPKRVAAVQSSLLDKIEHFDWVKVSCAVGASPETHTHRDPILERLARVRFSRRSLVAAFAGPAGEMTHVENARFRNRPVTVACMNA